MFTPNTTMNVSTPQGIQRVPVQVRQRNFMTEFGVLGLVIAGFALYFVTRRL